MEMEMVKTQGKANTHHNLESSCKRQVFHQVHDEARMVVGDDGSAVLLKRHGNRSMLAKVKARG